MITTRQIYSFLNKKILLITELIILKVLTGYLKVFQRSYHTLNFQPNTNVWFGKRNTNINEEYEEKGRKKEVKTTYCGDFYSVYLLACYSTLRGLISVPDVYWLVSNFIIVLRSLC